MSSILKKMPLGTIILQTLLSIVMVFGIHAGASAATPPPSTDSSSHFNVNSYLTTTSQKQSYFKSANPIASFIIQIVNFLVLTIGSLCFLALVVGGFILMTSHGNENSLTKGKDVIKMALIGLVVTLGSYFITAFVQSLFYELPPK